MTSRNFRGISVGGESPGVGKFRGGTERNVGVQLADAHHTGTATIRRARGFTCLRAPAKHTQVTVIAYQLLDYLKLVSRLTG